jgi:hypothetical protein
MEKIMHDRWETTDGMLEKVRLAVRANFLNYLGVVKCFWDEEINDLRWEFVKTANLMVDDKGVEIDDLSFIAEFINNQSLAEIVKKFPKKKAELLKSLDISKDDDSRMGSTVGYIEFWTPKITVWKCQDVILDKIKNPHWDWGQDTITDENGKTKSVSYNFFSKPTYPYSFFQTFNLGESVYSDASLIQETITLQDGVNKGKRQISDNADEAQGTLVGSGDGIDKTEFSKIEPEPNLKVWIDHGDPRKVISRIPGNPIQGYVFDNLIHSQNSIDNIWGIHSITRGQDSGAKTATQDILQQRQDYGRIDDIVKAYEDFNERIYKINFQMMLVHYADEHVFSFEDEDDLVVSRQDIINAYSKTVKRKVGSDGEMEIEQDGDFRQPKIMVKRDSTLPNDEVSRRIEALELWARSGISPVDLYKKLGWENPREAAYRLMLWQKSPETLFPEFRQGQQPAEQGENPSGAISDFQIISQGQDPGPNQEVNNPQTATAHIEQHNQQLESPEFEQLSPEIQQLFVNHVKEEIELVKSLTQGGQNAIRQI